MPLTTRLPFAADDLADLRHAASELSTLLDSDNEPYDVATALTMIDGLGHWAGELQAMLLNQIVCALEP